jgi:hypothetical protein
MFSGTFAGAQLDTGRGVRGFDRMVRLRPVGFGVTGRMDGVDRVDEE